MYEPEANLAIVASPQDPEGTVLLLEPNEKPLAKNYQQELYQAGVPVIVFFTENIHEEFQRLKNRGVKFKKDSLVYKIVRNLI
jgi:4-hydroxyphenylpyruvate dioxygenase-like putative hemolysin